MAAVWADTGFGHFPDHHCCLISFHSKKHSCPCPGVWKVCQVLLSSCPEAAQWVALGPGTGMTQSYILSHWAEIKLEHGSMASSV